jgi:glucosamine-6-phosphate deaminase
MCERFILGRSAALIVIRHILTSPSEVALAASLQASALIRTAIRERGVARIVAATGQSQQDFLAHLITQKDIDWKSVVLFHLDEYLGLSPDHPASMQRYIRERIVEPAGITQTYLLDGNDENTHSRAAAAIRGAVIDVAFTGIGENGHLAFNEPPADFSTNSPFILVDLAEPSRQQQVNEGWFRSIQSVPRRAVTMSVQQILKARSILCIATGTRKAAAVRLCFGGDVSPLAPASALRLHPATTTYLDLDAAALLEGAGAQ